MKIAIYVQWHLTPEYGCNKIIYKVLQQLKSLKLYITILKSNKPSKTIKRMITMYLLPHGNVSL